MTWPATFLTVIFLVGWAVITAAGMVATIISFQTSVTWGFVFLGGFILWFSAGVATILRFVERSIQ